MSDQGDYFTRSEEAASLLADALGEIIRLNQEARETKEKSDCEFRQREAELVARIEAQANVIEDQNHAIARLKLQLSNVPTTRPQRHVAAEMGLLGPDQRAEARDLAEEDRHRERRCEEFNAMLSGAEQLRDGMAKSSGLVAEKEPDQK